ncbi:MAG: DUF3299 domain-containing protein [Cyanobacteria bacterium J06639_1]
MNRLAVAALATALGVLSVNPGAWLPESSISGMGTLAAGRSPRTVGWPDLMPEPDFADPFAPLTDDQASAVMFISDVRDQRARFPDEELDPEFDEYVQAELDRLLAQNIDVDGIIAEWDSTREARIAFASAINTDLDGTEIKMPGYVLPLEFNRTNVTEFLLVPYVGACIHVPPPPPNQIVLVQVPEGFKNRGLFAPVWVTGKLTAQAVNKNLEVYDGDIDVNIGYGMEADVIEPYEL